jgi:CRISPR-associated protein Csn2
MKLVHPILEKPIKLDENTLNVLVIESQKAFSGFIKELFEQSNGGEGNFIISEDLDRLSVEKDVELILEPFSIELNNRKIISRLYKQLEHTAVSEDFYLDYNKASNQILSFIEKISQTTENKMVYSQNVDLSALFKAVDLSIEEDYENLVEKIHDYMSVIQEFEQVSFFIFVNLKKFISSEELKELFKAASYKKMHLLLLENVVHDDPIACEKRYIIDSDLCAIY